MTLLWAQEIFINTFIIGIILLFINFFLQTRQVPTGIYNISKNKIKINLRMRHDNHRVAQIKIYRSTNYRRYNI